MFKTFRHIKMGLSISLITGFISSTGSTKTIDSLKEFQSGQKNLLVTKGLPKAKGVNLTMEYPKSWTILQAENEEILCHLEGSSNPVYEEVTISITEEEELKGKALSMDDQLKLMNKFTLENFKSSAKQGSEYFSSENTTVGGVPARVVEVLFKEVSTGRENGLNRARQLIFYVGPYNLIFTFKVMGNIGQEDVIARHTDLLKPLFTGMIESITLPDVKSYPVVQSNENMWKKALGKGILGGFIGLLIGIVYSIILLFRLAYRKLFKNTN